MKQKLLLLLFTILVMGNISISQTFTFTNAGATGPVGPTQAQVNNEYSGTSLAGSVTVVDGIQYWTVPSGGNYLVEVWGAQGGDGNSPAPDDAGGLGAYLSGEFNFSTGQELIILIGQKGLGLGDGSYSTGGGGGGTFVASGTTLSNAVPLIVAGGGGGTSPDNAAYSVGMDASITTAGTLDREGAGNPGTNGNGGEDGCQSGSNASVGAGGGGFYSNGIALTSSGTNVNPGFAFINGGAGGFPTGGFGGGGGFDGTGNYSASAGGGYSGGTGGNRGCLGNGNRIGGGGGGSYNSGTNQNNLIAVNTGHGLVVITPLVPCTSPPSAGTTVASDVSVCSGSTVTLGLSGNTIGTGLSYQWQSSADSLTWNNIPGDTNASSIATITSDIYFRCELTCSGVSDFSIPVKVKVSPLLSGTFSIGATGDYQDFASALNALDCGVSGPVTFNVLPGIYNEQIIIPEIPGTSSTNTVTFKGSDPANTKLTFAQNVSAERYTVRFSQASWITLDSLTIEADDSGSYGWVIHFLNDNSDITIKNCSIITSPSATGTTFNGIIGSNSTTGVTTACNSHNILIENNVISGGYYNLRFNGASSARLQNIHIIGNELLEAHYYGVYFNFVDEPLIDRNNFFMRETGNNSGRAIHLTNSSPFTVTNNQMTDIGYYGMYITNAPASTANRSLIANNTIGGGFRNTGALGGGIRILGTSTSYIDIFHNSINVDAGNNAGLNVRVSSPSNLRVKNNSFVYSETGTGYAIYISHASSIEEIDHNNYHSEGSNFVYYNGSARASLVDLQSVNAPANNDVNSVSGNPFFVSPTFLMPMSSILDGAGTPIASVPNDITGQARSTTAPDIGAYEYTPVSGDISIVNAEIDRQAICYNPNDTVYITVENLFGGTIDFSIDTLIANWEVTGPVNSSGTIMVSSGLLNPGNTLTLMDINVDMTEPGDYYLNAFIEPNGANQSALNDTLEAPFEITVLPIVAAAPKVLTVTSPFATPEINARSPLFPGGGFFITEICHFRGSGNGAPTGGWPSYLLADDYIEITGVPYSDLGGITLEQWSTSALLSNNTFPQGTILGPNGTAVIAVGQLGSSVPDPSNHYYHDGYTSNFGSGTAIGRILRDASGNIIDAVGYGTYTFPAAAGVTAADWSGNTPALSSAGNRLEGPYTKDASNWINSGTSPQDPNTLNNNVMVPVPGVLTGFTWSYDGTVIDTVPQTPVGPFTNIDTFMYIASYNSACGVYTDTAFVVINLTNVTPSISNVSCFGANDGSITATSTGGDAPYSYSWNHDPNETSSTVTGLAPGTYVVTITDDNNWPATDTITITEPTEMIANLTITPEYCETSPGSISVDVQGGIPGYSFDWGTGNTTSVADSLKAGTYSVTVTDSINCTITFTDSVPLQLFTAIVSDVTDVKCFGENSGKAGVTVIGGNTPYTFDWSNGLDSSLATGLAADTYFVTVTDMSGCTSTDTIVITEPTKLMPELISVKDVSCFGGDDGEAVVDASGGTPPYFYNLTQPQDSGVFTNLRADEYTYSVSDSNNCVATNSFTVDEQDMIDTNVNVNGVTLVANLGNASYQWINCNGNVELEGETNQSFTATANAPYKVRITFDGCTEYSDCHNIQSVGMEKLNEGSKLKVYPNPNNGRFKIETDKEGDFILVNGVGQVVQKIQVNAENNFKAEISGISTGVYYLVGMENDIPVQKKIMVTK